MEFRVSFLRRRLYDMFVPEVQKLVNELKIPFEFLLYSNTCHVEKKRFIGSYMAVRDDHSLSCYVIKAI